MTKKQYIEKISIINNAFINADNHGRNGNNWFYPTENTVAYNVKMHAWGDIDTLRGYLTPLQDKRYTDEELRDVIDNEHYDTCEMLVGDLQEQFPDIEDIIFAGRMGGWIEVSYRNYISYDFNGCYTDEELEERYTLEELKEEYTTARILEKVEQGVRKEIEKQHAGYNKYVDTPEYYKDLADTLIPDDEIKEEISQEIKELKTLIK